MSYLSKITTILFHVVFIINIIGCTDQKTTTQFGNKPQYLTSEAVNILGFENYTQWNGASANSDNHSEGAKSIVANVNEWTEITSIPLSSLGTVGDNVSVDILMPEETPYWGEVRIIVKIPSLGDWYKELGSQSTMQSPANKFKTYSFIIPEDVKTKLNGSYTDLTISVVINAPSGQYLVDNLTFFPSQTNDTEITIDSSSATQSEEDTLANTDSETDTQSPIDTDSTSSTDSDTVLEGVYALSPDEVPDDQLNAFMVDSRAEMPVGTPIPALPDELLATSVVI